MRNLLFLLMALSLLTGCKTPVQDVRGPSDFCEVHHMEMKSVPIVAPRGNVPLSPEYVQASVRFFPHSVPPDYPKNDSGAKWMIYICEDCVRAQQQWLNAHPKNSVYAPK